MYKTGYGVPLCKFVLVLKAYSFTNLKHTILTGKLFCEKPPPVENPTPVIVDCEIDSFMANRLQSHHTRSVKKLLITANKLTKVKNISL